MCLYLYLCLCLYVRVCARACACAGHPYVIADCGGAVEESVCNECGAAIGGAQHRVRGDNRTVRSAQELLRPHASP